MASAGRISVAQASFTPAAASHVAGDVVGGAQLFKGLSMSAGAGVQIISASMLVESATLETTAWRVYLFGVTPPSALADDAPFTLAAGDRAAFLGYVDIAQLVDAGDSLYVQSDNLNKAIRAPGYSAYGYLVNLTTLTPAAVAHTVTLFALG